MEQLHLDVPLFPPLSAHPHNFKYFQTVFRKWWPSSKQDKSLTGIHIREKKASETVGLLDASVD